MAGWRREGEEKDMDKEAWRLGRRVAEQARDEISDVPWERQGDPNPESGRGVWIRGGRSGRERGRLGGGCGCC